MRVKWFHVKSTQIQTLLLQLNVDVPASSLRIVNNFLGPGFLFLHIWNHESHCWLRAAAHKCSVGPRTSILHINVRYGYWVVLRKKCQFVLNWLIFSFFLNDSFKNTMVEWILSLGSFIRTPKQWELAGKVSAAPFLIQDRPTQTIKSAQNRREGETKKLLQIFSPQNIATLTSTTINTVLCACSFMFQ